MPPVEEASQEYVQKRRELHGDITDAAEAWICRGISVYEWQRRYGVQSRAESWQGLCETPDAVPLPSEPISP